MSSVIQMNGTRRESVGKGGARKARAAGQLPGVVYGHGEEPMAVVTGGPAPTQAKVETPMQKPLPTIEVVEKPRLPEKHHGLSLSPKRKILAGVLGGLALGSLVAAVALTATDGNPTTMDCNASAGVNKICVLDNKIPSSVAYVAAGAFTVGTVLTLLWPESKPQVKESAAAEAAK